MTIAYCGKTASISGSFGNCSAVSWTFERSSTEFDVTYVGTSSTYGDFITCNKVGTLTINTYIRPNVEPGDNVTFTCSNCAGESYSVPLVIQSQSTTDPAAGLIEFVTVGRVTGSPTIT